MASFNATYNGLILIEQFFHTETQDCKTVLDAHFARCMRFLKVFMKTWKINSVTQINTPNGSQYALAWKGCNSNMMVQVVKLERPWMSKTQKMIEPAA